MERLRTRTDLVCLFVASLLLWFCAGYLYQTTRPYFGPGTVEFCGKVAEPFSIPFDDKQVPKGKFVLKESLELSRWHPDIFAFYPQDVLWGIRVNGHEVAARGLPLSVVHHEGRSISLAPYLHAGINNIELEMEADWGEASLHVYVSPWDKWPLVIAMLVLLGTTAMGRFIVRFCEIKISAAEMAILLGGILIRYLYLSGTPYFIRAYDWWGHVAYLDYVSGHLSLPDPPSDWESYQPPFYYYGLGSVTRFLLMAGMPEAHRYLSGRLFRSCVAQPRFWLAVGSQTFSSRIG